MISDLFKTLVWDNLVKVAINKLFAALPSWATWGPFGTIISMVIIKAADFIYNELGEWIDVEQIAFKNNQLKKEFDNYYVNLKLIARENGELSDEFISARKDSQKHFFDFIQFGITRTP